jgi:hypothetical protein
VPLAFLALPNCSFDGIGWGHKPRNAVLLCDIENHATPRRCATDMDLLFGVRLESAAVDLVRGSNWTVALDYRPGAAAEAGLTCPPGTPVAITYHDPFPRGTATCLNAFEMLYDDGPFAGDPKKACEYRCNDTFGESASEETWAFCQAHAKVSTNADPFSLQLLSGCEDNGTPKANFATALDPRRVPRAVHWRDMAGVWHGSGSGNTLTRTAPGGGAFDAGAASKQAVSGGDAWVEFTATATDTGKACGFSVGAATDASPDLDPTLDGIGFAVRLGALGNISIIENGVLVPGPDPGGTFGTYADGDRIRIVLKDNLNGTASVAYYLIGSSCSAGPLCDGTLLRSDAGPAPYPFRVDASIATPGAVLTRVEMVHIKPF